MRPKMTPEMIAKALFLQGAHKSQAEIAFIIGVNRATVSRTLKKVNAAAFEKLKKDLAAEKGRQVRQLQRIAAEAFAAFQRSGQDAETVKTTEDYAAETADGPVRAITKVERTVKGQAGDAAYLKTVMEAMVGIRNILGIGREVDDGDVPTVRDALADAEAREREYQPSLPPPRPDQAT